MSINFKETKIVSLDSLQPNAYNPNRMTGAKYSKEDISILSKHNNGYIDMMSLLMNCISKYGFLFPIIVTWDEFIQKYRIIDGYHRYEALKRLGATQVSIIDMQIPYHDAVQLTVLMNRIKGFHQVELMSDLIMKLEDLGLQDNEICDNLGMESEEYLRLKQQLGIAHAFKHHNYSNTWEVDTNIN